MRHFDVQIMGGACLHRGWIAEMKTGEGKTLVATLPVALNSLAGRGVHLVTVNDYLARRDATWMSPVYDFLGITVGVIQAQMPSDQRRAAYGSDVTYGTNSEFGFDYLRDNLAVELAATVQRGHAFAIVDEVDSILIDEARTPLIISGQPEDAASTYYELARIAKRLKVGEDYEVDEKRKTVAPTEECVHKVERCARHRQPVRARQRPDGQPLHPGPEGRVALQAGRRVRRHRRRRGEDRRRVHRPHHGGPALERGPAPGGRGQGGREDRGGEHHRRDRHDPELLPHVREARRHDGHGGHRGQRVRRDLQARGHARSRPTCRWSARDQNDYIFKTKDEKFAAVVDDIAERHETGQPVLVGTIDIETSEHLSGLLSRRGVPHNVLNAKQHEREAEIIQDAGQPGAVTIATNMAGRGVDIKLGEGVPELGGLYVLGTERHESRRIDNQLRGRSGRQGDPGETRFYLSAEDQVVRLFAGDRIYKILDRLGPPEGEPIEHKLLTRQIEGAQKRVEEHNFEIRKNVLKYDDVLNKQREVVYEQRRDVLEGADISDEILIWIDETVEGIVEAHTDLQFAEEWDLEGMMVGLRSIYPVGFTLEDLGPAGRSSARTCSTASPPTRAAPTR